MSLGFGVHAENAGQDKGQEGWRLPDPLQPMTQVESCESLEHLEAIARRCDGDARALSPKVLSIRCFYGGGAGLGDVSVFIRRDPSTMLDPGNKFGLERERGQFGRLLTSPRLYLPEAILEGRQVTIRGQATLNGYPTVLTVDVGGTKTESE